MLATLTVFACSWMAVAYVLRTTGPHTWGNAHSALRGIQEALADYQRETGDTPPIELVEVEILTAWEHGADAISRDYDGRLEIAFSLADDRRLRLWDSPPRVVRRPDSPIFGFYLEGEDGASASQGEDPDDINSWDFGSTSFYYDRLRHRRWISNGLWAIVPTTLTFIVGWVCFVRKPNKTNKPAHTSAGNVPN